MNKEELLIYEMPTIAEFVSINWLQKIIATFLANKIRRKMKRYENRKAREKFINKYIRNYE